MYHISDTLLVIFSVMAMVNMEACPEPDRKSYLTMFTQNDNTLFKKMDLFVASSRPFPVEVKVLYGNNLSTDQFTLLPKQVKHVKLSNDNELPTGNVVMKTGVLVTSSDDVTVEVLNAEGSNSDMFTVREALHLGKEYITVIPKKLTDTGASTIGIAALHDSTFIIVIFPNIVSNVTVDVRGNLTSFTDSLFLELSSRDVLQLQSLEDLSGTYIQSDKPVAVVSGVNRTKNLPGHCQDASQDQVAPVSTLGTRYIVFTLSPLTNGSVFVYIVSTEPNTVVSYNNIDVNIPERGDQIEITLPRSKYDFVQFMSSAPVLIGMVPQSGKNKENIAPVEGDAALVYIKPLPFVSNLYTFYVPDDEDFKNQKRLLVIIVESEAVGGIQLNDQPLTNATWFPVPSTSYSGTYYVVNVTGTADVLCHSSGKPFAAYLVGYHYCNCYMFSLMAYNPVRSQCHGNSLSSTSIHDRWLSMTLVPGTRMTSLVMKKVKVPDINRCLGFCLMFSECIGVNFSNTSSVDNCEVIFSHVNCEETNSEWTFYNLS